MKFLKLYSCCKIIDGYARSIIVDLQRLKYDFIPKALSFIIKEFNDKCIEEVKLQYTNEEIEYIEEYISFLLEQEYAFKTSNPNDFPEISTDFYIPNIISNASINLDFDNITNLRLIIKLLNELSCIALELRINYPVDLIDLFKNIELRKTKLQHINIILKNEDNLLNNSIVDLLEIPQIKTVYIYNSNTTKKVFNKYKTKAVYYINSDNLRSCGKIRPENFIPSIKVFNESMNFNSCLNRKISFDLDGSVKNCNFSKNVIGNIFQDGINKLIENKEFNKYWNLTKDNIDICKDCEFRYICVDCRVFISKENNLYSKPINCSYNPYIAKWEDEKGYCKVEDLGYYDSNDEFVLNRNKLTQFNVS
ncbi:MAG: grasp-with-spasm system SPASM domain peptide maturase [Bacillota bacterium]